VALQKLDVGGGTAFRKLVIVEPRRILSLPGVCAHVIAHASASSSACSNTVRVAFSSLSGG
jgi:hypothetical protein